MIAPLPPVRLPPVRRLVRKVRDDDVPLGMRIGVLGKKWTLQILGRAATDRGVTFGQLLHSQPRLSRRILSLRLKQLREEGYVRKALVDANPRRPIYVLSDKGRDALPLLHGFSELIKRYGEVLDAPELRPGLAEDVDFDHPALESARGPLDSTTLRSHRMEKAHRAMLETIVSYPKSG
ncbi:MAG: helix-turn-helix domain-containing protein [Thermoplasmata archaeon]